MAPLMFASSLLKGMIKIISFKRTHVAGGSMRKETSQSSYCAEIFPTAVMQEMTQNDTKGMT